jgi:hypothetical protein
MAIEYKRVRHLIGTTSEWAANPALVLGNGELGLEVTAKGKKIKIGDGVSVFADLPYTESGSVKSVGLSVPTGFAVSDSPVTDSGTLSLEYENGYSLPSDAKQAEWDSYAKKGLRWDGGDEDLDQALALESLELDPDSSPTFLGLTVTGIYPVEIPLLHGDVDGVLMFPVRNISGITLKKGTPVTTGGSVADTDILEVVATDPAIPGAQYASGILWDSLLPGEEGYAVSEGKLLGVDTAAYAGGRVWVAAGGGLTSTRPASGAQQVATVGRRDAVSGSLLVAIQRVDPTAAEVGALTETEADARYPLATAVTASLAKKADLVGGVIPTSQIPAIAITDYLGEVASQAEMLALVGQRGDWCLRTDADKVGMWVLSGDDASLLSNWVKIVTPLSAVQSVNGQIGIVVLRPADIGAQPADPDLTAIAALTTAPFGRGLLTAADAAAARTVIGAVAGDDSRLSDARDWTAQTVTQAEAEAGTSGTRRAWTAQRVRQAIDNWWSGNKANTGAIGESFPSTGRFTSVGLGGVAPRTGYAAVLGSNVLSRARIVTVSGSTYTCDIRVANRFMLAAAIAGNTTIAFSNVADLAVTSTFAEYVEVEVDFRYTSGIITISAAGFTTTWDGNSAATPTAGEIETLIVRITPAIASTPFSTATVYVAPMRGRT